jgi:hypothetical protein
MSGGDRMDSSTQVPVIRCVWAPMAMSYRASSDGAYPVLKTPGHSYQEHGCILCWG